MTTDERDTMQAKLDRLNVMLKVRDSTIDKMVELAGHVGWVYATGDNDEWLAVHITGFFNGKITGTMYGICEYVSGDKNKFQHNIAAIRTAPPGGYCKSCTTEHYPDHMHSQSQCRDCHEAEETDPEDDDPFAVYDDLEDDYPRWRWS